MPGLLYSLALLWAIIYAVNKRRQQKSNRLPLPLHGVPRTQAAKYQVKLRPLHLIIETTAFNHTHDKFAWTLLRNPATKDALKLFYGFGAVLGIVGMFGGVGMLLWTTWKLSYLLLSVPPGSNGLVKRGATSPPSQGSGLPFYPIVPGVTTPLDDLPALLFSLFISLCFHEFGHAVAAAVDSVPLTSVGASLFVLIPSAFVSISSGTMSRLPAMGRLRIASAGPHHNILIFTIVSLLGQARFGKRMLAIGYEDISRLGKVVISIDDDSPLNGNIIPGDMITRLDDFSLGSNIHRDLWSQYFLEPDTVPTSASTGWCVETEWFRGQPSDCCSSDASHATGVACFSTLIHSTVKMGHCLDPIPIMARNDKARCSSTNACAGNSTCVMYASPSPLLRIGVSDNDTLKTILWSGPPLEVWQQVEVGDLRPRALVYPLWLPKSLANYMSYLKMIMLSLFVMNLFPLSFLDGGQILQALADLLIKEPEITHDLETGRRGLRGLDGRGRIGERKNLIKSSAEVGTWVLMGASCTLGLVHWYYHR